MFETVQWYLNLIMTSKYGWTFNLVGSLKWLVL